MTYAIIEASGKQLWVEPGSFYDLNKIEADPGDSVFFERVLLINDLNEIHIGKPCIADAKIQATVLRHLRGKKVIVYKMRPKKGTRIKKGHRQELTRLVIKSINIGNKVIN
uniref:ribosomal protein L21 n=1 Tax=Porphyridium aerugineum TaxID=2792 RepID=UPI001FCD800A|nr:ribosomal protein L21 [Porphyridium aerugineum]UNJ17846.1 ribosomal protein L21 [Porphyridium aerugineum]